MKPCELQSLFACASSHEHLEAQVAAFTDSRIENTNDSSYVLRNIGEIASGDAADMVRVLEVAETVYDSDGNRHAGQAGTQHMVATKQDYVEYLRDVGGFRHNAIDGRRAMTSNLYFCLCPLLDTETKLLRSELDDHDFLH